METSKKESDFLKVNWLWSNTATTSGIKSREQVYNTLLPVHRWNLNELNIFTPFCLDFICLINIH